MTLLHKSLARAVDGTATVLASSLMFSRSRPSSNTIKDLGLYQQHGIHALFGGELPIPVVTAKERRGGPRFRLTNLTFDSFPRPLTARGQALRDGEHACNGRAHARWVRHRRPRRDGSLRPTLVFLHSWMAPVSRAEDRVLLPYIARRLDADVVGLQLPYHGRRKPNASAFHGEYFWTADLARTFEALRQAIYDARSLISWIRLQQEPAQPVGVMGVSLGGMVALGVACFEPTLDFAVPVAAHLDLAGVLADSALLNPMRKELAGHGWTPADVHTYTQSLGLNDLLPAIPRERLLFVVGRYDRIMDTERTLALWRRWGEPGLRWFEAGHLGIITHLGGILHSAKPFIQSVRTAPTVSLRTDL